MNGTGPPADRLDAAAIQSALTTRWLGRDAGVQVVGRIDSTNLRLQMEARSGTARAGAVLLAEEQSSGRGRGDHRWESPPGAGLYCSVLLQPALPGERLGLLTLACGVAVCETCEDLGVRPRLRWPNDVMIRERKLAGILCELVIPIPGPQYAPAPRIANEGPVFNPEPRTPNPEPRCWVIAGIGLNVRLAPATLPPPLDATVTSLAHELDRSRPAAAEAALPGRSELAARLLDRLEQRTEQCRTAPAELLASWERRWGDRGRRVQVTDGPSDITAGIARGIDECGALLLDIPGRSEVAQVLGGTVRPV